MARNSAERLEAARAVGEEAAAAEPAAAPAAAAPAADGFSRVGSFFRSHSLAPRRSAKPAGKGGSGGGLPQRAAAATPPSGGVDSSHAPEFSSLIDAMERRVNLALRANRTRDLAAHRAHEMILSNQLVSSDI